MSDFVRQLLMQELKDKQHESKLMKARDVREHRTSRRLVDGGRIIHKEIDDE